MATAAAWWPARAVSRLSVMAALSGRPSRPRPVHRSLVLAFALVVCGVGAIAAARPTSDHVRPLVLIVGLLAVVVGVVFVSPAAVRALAVPARRLPFAPRLALRDLARYQARAAAALAAITLGLGISVAVVAIAGANEYRSDEGNLSAQQLLIRFDDPAEVPSPDADRVRAEPARRPSGDGRGRSRQRRGGPSARLRDEPGDVDGSEHALTHRGRRPRRTPTPRNSSAYPYVATPEVLAHYGIDPATIDPATDLLTVYTGAVELADFSTPPGPERAGDEGAARRSSAVQRRAQLVDHRSSHDAARLGTNARGLARRVARRARPARRSPRPAPPRPVPGSTIDVRSDQDGLAALRTGATTAGVVLAIAIVMMAIGLLRGESARDLRTLTATGAAGRTRRALTAATAGTLALLGVVLGMAGVYIALLASFHAELGKLAPVPVPHLLIIAVGLPLAATAAGWLMGGREPRRVRAASHRVTQTTSPFEPRFGTETCTKPGPSYKPLRHVTPSAKERRWTTKPDASRTRTSADDGAAVAAPLDRDGGGDARADPRRLR